MVGKKPVTLAPKIVDIAPPGKSVPSASSRSIIVSSRPIMRQDPMMVTVPSYEPAPSDIPQPLGARAARTLSVLPAANNVDLALTSPATELSLSPDSMLVSDEVLPSASSPSPIPNQVANAPAAQGSAIVTPPVPATIIIPPVEPTQTVPRTDTENDDQLAPNQTLEEVKRKEQEAADARLVAQEQVIASRQYYVPITAARTNRTILRPLLVLLLVLLLAVIWFDIVLDAGIVHVAGLHSITHFFNK